MEGLTKLDDDLNRASREDWYDNDLSSITTKVVSLYTFSLYK